MKLLVLQETDWIKRGPHQQHHLMDRMALRGHEIRVIDHEYLWKDDRDKKIITGRKEIRGAYKIFPEADITLIRPGMIKIAGLDMASILYFHNKEIKKQIDEFKPDVIIAFGILNAYLGMRQAKKNNIPFVYYLIDHLHTLLPGEFKRSIAKQFERATLKGADKILVINKGLKDYAVEMGGDINKISVIPAGVDLERFNPQVDGSVIREKYGIKKDEILLFFMGKDKKKDNEFIIFIYYNIPMNTLMQKCHSVIDNFTQTIKVRGEESGAEIEDLKEQALPFDIDLPDEFSRVSSDDEIDIRRKLDKDNFLLTDIKSDTSGINNGVNNLNIKFDAFSSRLERILEKLVER